MIFNLCIRVRYSSRGCLSQLPHVGLLYSEAVSFASVRLFYSILSDRTRPAEGAERAGRSAQESVTEDRVLQAVIMWWSLRRKS